MTSPAIKTSDEDLACPPGKWLICSDPSGIDGDAGYIMHQRDPMFICRWSEDEVEAEDTFVHVFETGYKLTLYDFNFKPELPEVFEMRAACVSAVRVINDHLTVRANLP